MMGLVGLKVLTGVVVVVVVLTTVAVDVETVAVLSVALVVKT